MRRAGFTLVELLVVVGIFALSATGAVMAFRFRSQVSASSTTANTIVAHVNEARSRLLSGTSLRPCPAREICTLPMEWVVRPRDGVVALGAVYADASNNPMIEWDANSASFPSTVRLIPGDDIRMQLIEGKPRFVDERGNSITEQQVIRVLDASSSVEIVLDAPTGSIYVASSAQ